MEAQQYHEHNLHNELYGKNNHDPSHHLPNVCQDVDQHHVLFLMTVICDLACLFFCMCPC